MDTSDSQRLDVTENAVPNAPAPGDPPPPPLDSESSHNGIPSNVDVDATAAGSDSDDGSAEGRRESPRSNENTRADGQGTTAGGNDGNLVAGENTSLDEPPPDGNRNESSSDEEEQPYWAKFEEDKSVPTEEELKLIEEQDDEINALHRKYREEYDRTQITALIHVQMITGKKLLLNHLTTLNICQQRQGAYHGP